MKTVVISGVFDAMRGIDLRFFEEAAKLGSLHVLLWADDIAQRLTGTAPKFPIAERKYFWESARYVEHLTVVEAPPAPDTLPQIADVTPDVWAIHEREANAAKKAYCTARSIEYHVITASELAGYPVPETNAYEQPTSNKKVLVTGCYDWFHSGHVRFFEEASEYGDLYVVVGNDANVEHLKGAGHPMFKEDERRYITGAIRFVTQALISTGMGWMDAEPQIALVKPDIYLVNEDGDKPEKRAFCDEHDLEYVVLKRLPKEGLTRRSSTDLRGF